MNVHAPITLTVAEQALLNAFDAAAGELPGDAAVISARDRLLHAVRVEGLPTRRVEAWHYTDLRALLRSVPAADPAASAKVVAPLVEGAHVLSILDGKASTKGAPKGVSVASYGAALTAGTSAADLAERGADDAIGRLNGAFVKDGLAITVGSDADLSSPIEIQVAQSRGQSHVRLPVTVEEGVTATLIERHISTDDAPSLVTAVTDLTVGKGADVTYVIVQQQGETDSHLGQIRFTIGQEAKLTLFVINAGGKLVRQEIHGVVTGEGSNLTLRAVNLMGGETHTDVTFTMGHDVPNTTSTEIIRNVLFDRARGVFQGQIRVAPDAQKTDAKMACNTLLLSDDADLSAKPELEIFADDVQCGHGATVADIDPTQFYYLQARGIPAPKARALLIKAFVAEIVEELDDEPLVEALESVIEAWLDKHSI
ncbi:Fe-S cluster assembly protein SufD [Rhizobium sp. RU20A]|uniref:Fe-S cluster assembly protein SufD n=1 Tax=Rhizobium sp. RU20A TaxID=1907412 RepID=UPI000955AE5A|nr:Fe-S cluster assembly protein SufD [Rhizobium sp. RU20A]SIQ07697.1 Fe-S cluster assembly protein SufD [Rhizobium sp. RU20A]